MEKKNLIFWSTSLHLIKHSAASVIEIGPMLCLAKALPYLFRPGPYCSGFNPVCKAREEEGRAT